MLTWRDVVGAILKIFFESVCVHTDYCWSAPAMRFRRCEAESLRLQNVTMCVVENVVHCVTKTVRCVLDSGNRGGPPERRADAPSPVGVA